MRIFRWSDPEAATYVAEFEADFDWLAVAAEGEPVTVHWHGQQTRTMADGTVLVAGHEYRRRERERTPLKGRPDRGDR